MWGCTGQIIGVHRHMRILCVGAVVKNAALQNFVAPDKRTWKVGQTIYVEWADLKEREKRVVVSLIPKPRTVWLLLVRDQIVSEDEERKVTVSEANKRGIWVSLAQTGVYEVRFLFVFS